MTATETEVEYVTCHKSDMDDVATMTIPDDKEKTTAFNLYAPMIQINWQSSDRAIESNFAGTQSLSSLDVETMSTLATAGDAPSGVSTVAFPSVSFSAQDQYPEYTEPSNSENGASTGNKEGSSDGPKPLSLSTELKVSLGVAGGVLAVVFVAITFICAWRKRKNKAEEEEFDRMYGMKNVGSSTAELRHEEEIPGWHRGRARQPTTPIDPFRSGGVSDLMAPPAPYHPPPAYR